MIKLRERSHSFAGYRAYISQYLIEKYSDVSAGFAVNEIDALNTTVFLISSHPMPSIIIYVL